MFQRSGCAGGGANLPYQCERRGGGGRGQPVDQRYLQNVPPGALEGRVTVVESLGPETIVTLETAFGEVTTRVRGMEAIDFDVEVPFSFDLARLHLFDATSDVSVLRPGAFSGGAKPFRPSLERQPALAPQARSN